MVVGVGAGMPFFPFVGVVENLGLAQVPAVMVKALEPQVDGGVSTGTDTGFGCAEHVWSSQCRAVRRSRTHVQ
jgi:hypothetical protein